MPDDTPTPDPQREPKPSPINGPAFFVFGLFFVFIAFAMDMRVLALPAIAIMLLGILGIWLQRRYEKAAGIEDVLPGGRPKDDE